MNSELEKLIEKYRITVNGLADLEAAAAEKVIKERGFVTLNGLLVGTGNPAGEHNEPAAPAPSDNTAENTPVAPAPVEGSNEPNEPTPVVPAPSTPAPSTPAPVENPGVTPVTEGPVSNDTNLGTEVASGERSAEPVTDTEESSEENSSEEEGEPVAGRKPKKKKN